MSVCLHLPLCQADLRAPVSNRLLATDATPSAAGAVAAHMPGKIARALYQMCEQRGAHTRLDTSAE